MVRVGLVTIGQSPRVDVTGDLLKLLPSGVEVLEVGALDELKPGEIEKLKPMFGETVYVTRLRSGVEVKISRERVIPLVGECISKIEGIVDVIGILCSGEFPDYPSSKPIIYPEKVLKGMASSIVYGGRVGILIPAVEQVDYARVKWGGLFRDLHVYPISPYTSSLSDFRGLGGRLRGDGVKLAIMDCIGYTLEQRDVLRGFGIMVLTARTALARAICELL
ncbi:MAG: AroM family protein [archaeon YNP-LCB-003-016]|uniref:AroM family protein n=1 Tax=Candidatus Culexarchaeum yellowstonense TaxID=2928963 RepID=UPI0026F078B7|nr:AroM family protein [Candidatus Culexarchaeum yellowstonense]MCR6692249.1 AroM family protein [Candidatus Culexarchaeum yellowstonense]